MASTQKQVAIISEQQCETRDKMMKTLLYEMTEDPDTIELSNLLEHTALFFNHHKVQMISPMKKILKRA